MYLSLRTDIILPIKCNTAHESTHELQARPFKGSFSQPILLNPSQPLVLVVPQQFGVGRPTPRLIRLYTVEPEPFIYARPNLLPHYRVFVSDIESTLGHFLQMERSADMEARELILGTVRVQRFKGRLVSKISGFGIRTLNTSIQGQKKSKSLGKIHGVEVRYKIQLTISCH